MFIVANVEVVEEARMVETTVTHKMMTRVVEEARMVETTVTHKMMTQVVEDGGDNSDPHDGDEPPEKKRNVIDDQPWGASGLGLDEYDKDRLVSNNWLTDKHINACSVLLKKANPSQSGLHHTITLAKSPHRCACSADFVQIAHINESHWVCI